MRNTLQVLFVGIAVTFVPTIHLAAQILKKERTACSQGDQKACAKLASVAQDRSKKLDERMAAVTGLVDETLVGSIWKNAGDPGLTEAAATRLDELQQRDWDIAAKENTPAAWRIFAQIHAVGPRNLEAIRHGNALDEAAWVAAQRQNSLASYFSYLDEGPKGLHATDADRIIESRLASVQPASQAELSSILKAITARLAPFAWADVVKGCLSRPPTPGVSYHASFNTFSSAGRKESRIESDNFVIIETEVATAAGKATMRSSSDGWAVLSAADTKATYFRKFRNDGASKDLPFGEIWLTPDGGGRPTIAYLRRGDQWFDVSSIASTSIK